MFKVASIAALLAATAIAQPASAQNWSGPYVGAYVGANAGTTTTADVNCEIDCDTPTLKKVRLTAGGTIGYNAQIDEHFVIGLEADLGLGGKDSNQVFRNNSPYNEVYTVRSKLNWIGTVRARAGLALDKTMLYATAGLAVSRASFSDSDFYAPGFNYDYGASTRKTMTGYAVGGGIEHSFGAFSVKAEFLHIDLGKSNRACFADLLGSSAGVCYSNGADYAQFYPTVNSARLGFNYRF